MSSDTERLALCASRYKVNFFSEITIEVLKEIYKDDRDLFYHVVRILSFYGVSFSGKLQSYNAELDEFPEILSIIMTDYNAKVESVIANNFNTDTLKSLGITQAKHIHGVPLLNLQNSLGVSSENSIELMHNESFEKIRITEQFNDNSFWELLTEPDNKRPKENFPSTSASNLQNSPQEQPISKLNLPKHLEQKLISAGVETLERLFDLSDRELYQIKEIKRNGVLKIKADISQYKHLAEAKQCLQKDMSEVGDINVLISGFELSVRARRCLENASIKTIADLFEYKIEDLKLIRGTGRKTINEIKQLKNTLSKNLRIGERRIAKMLQSDTILKSLNTRLSDAALSARSLKHLTAAGITYIYELTPLSKDEVIHIDKLGNNSFAELKQALEDRDLHFGLTFNSDQIEEIKRHSPTDSVEQLLRKEEILSVLKAAISGFDLSVRAIGSLNSAGVKYIYELTQLTEPKIGKFPNMGKKTVSELKDFVEEHGLRFGLVFDDEQLELIKHHKPKINFSVSNWLKEASNDLLHDDLTSFKERETDILKNRLWETKKKQSLEQIAVAYNVSRERIRQIETKLIKFYKKKYRRQLRYLFEWLDEESKTNGFIFNFSNSKINFNLTEAAQPIADFLVSLAEREPVIDWNCKVCSPIGEAKLHSIVIKVKNAIAKSRNKKSFSQQFLNDVIQDVAFTQGVSDNLDVACLTKYFKYHAKVREDRFGYYFGRKLKGARITRIFQDHFPNGLDLYKNSDALLLVLNERDPKIFEDMSARSAISNLTRQSDVFLWGRGFYIHEANVSVNEQVVKTVFDWIIDRFDKGHTRFQISIPFSLFQDELKANGIPNEYALYTLIRNIGSERVGQRKFPTLVDLDADEDINVGILEEVEDYIQQKNKAIPYAELKAEFVTRRGWKEYSLLGNLLIHSGTIFPWKDHSYIHTDLLPIDLIKLDDLINELVKKVKSISAPYSLKGAKKEMNILWEQACPDASVRTMIKLIRSVNPEQLIIERFSAHYTEDYQENISGASQLEDYFLEKNSEIHSDTLKAEFVHNRGWNEPQYYGAMHNAFLFKTGTSTFVHPATVGWKASLSSQVQVVMERYLDTQNQAACPYMQIQELLDEDELPELPNHIYWTKHLVKSIGGELEKFIFFDNLYIYANNTYDIDDLDDMIGYTLAKNFRLMIADRDDLETILWREEILNPGRAIPDGQFFEGSSIRSLATSNEIALTSIGREKYEKFKSA